MSPESPVASGLVVVDKPGGLTSRDVVARVRRLAGTRKVGHAGTLDPMATGVLVLGIGRATRLLGHLMLTEKRYDATIRLGSSTTTDDAEGEVVATAPTDHVTHESVLTELAHFVGEIDQVPSAVSAIKVDGRRAYDRVRAGEEVRLAARRVHVAAIELHEVIGSEVRVTVQCSSGTYIRALARDLGARLGTGGHLIALRRTAVGAFDLTSAHTLGQLQESFELLPIADAARVTFASLDLDASSAADVRVGRRLTLDLGTHGRPVALFAPDGEFLALYEQQGEIARAVAVFAQDARQ